MIGSRLKSARIKCEFSQQSMADLLGITRAAYARYENETSEPSFANLKIICTTLDVSSDWLLDTGRQQKIETEKDALEAILALKEAGASVASGQIIMDILIGDERELTQPVPIVLTVLENSSVYDSVMILNTLKNVIDLSESDEDRRRNEDAYSRYLEAQLQHLADKDLGAPFSPLLAEEILGQVKGIHFQA